MAKERSDLRCDQQMAFLVMSDFCYVFSRRLLDKLKKLEEEDRIWEGGQEEAEERPGLLCRFTPIAEIIIGKLKDQLGMVEVYNFDEFKEFTSAAEEFLAIFEENE